MPYQTVYITTILQLIITKRILPNIPRTKGNQRKKFGQLIEYNMRNTYFWKIIHKM